jgi:prepilin-type N-terminal cleavage/methylation domain-containing protein
MAQRSFHKFRKSLRFIWKRGQSAGFTLIELLVSIIIGALITILLLSLVVQLTQANQDDAARSQVQQDMQTAMDYVVQDLREAVFVYNGECLQGNGTPARADDLQNICPGVLNYIPASMTQPFRTPVLAFWRTKALPPDIQALCRDNYAQADTALPTIPCLPGGGYSLVVYAIDTNPNTNIWKGNARLMRYELSQFPEDGRTAADANPGFTPPRPSPSDTFLQWPFSTPAQGTGAGVFANQQTARPNNPAFTLVDFVDDKRSSTTGISPNCEEFAPFPGGNSALAKVPTAIANALSPKADSDPPRGFYACVRNGGLGDAGGSGANQDVLLTLVGNVSGKSGFAKQFDNRNRLSPLQTRVLVRGVVNKK